MVDADEYASRAPVGRLNGITGELGTILGPDGEGRRFVIIDSDERGVTVGFAQAEDLRATMRRAPQSLTEFTWTRP